MNNRQQPVEVVHTSDNKKECRQRALVLEAAGIGHEILGETGEFTLIVSASDAADARTELDAYTRENDDWQTVAATLPQRSSGWAGVMGYAAALLLVEILEHLNTFTFDWFAAGKTHAGLIRHGEWWRAITALTLHSDLVHLAGNIVIGGLVGLFAGQLLGSGLAWASILAAGTAGNLLNASIRHPDHTSVGASTAVFAALGLVAAYVWMRRRHLHASKLARWAPLVGGVVLLGYLGTGGVRTDVAAHVAGFVAGVVLGTMFARLGNRLELAARFQLLLGMGALAVLALAWAIALTSHTAQPV